VVIEMEDEDEE
jgi:hypothetical protein